MVLKTILLADDDLEDRMLIEHAFKAGDFLYDLRFVQDGEEVMDYLNRCGDYVDSSKSPRPNLILLDLNMPRKNGWEALREIKSSPDFRKIPVVILTTSQNEEDITQSYELGVNSFITKPVTYEALIDLIKTLEKYWFTICETPSVKGD